MTFLETLKDLGACSDGYKWAEENKINSMAEAWDKLQRPDWMLWLLNKQSITETQRKALVLWACDCAEDALTIFEEKYPDDKRPRECIEATRGFIAGTIGRDELLEKRRAASYSADAVAAYSASYSAAYACAAAYAAAAAAAACAAACAADAFADDAACAAACAADAFADDAAAAADSITLTKKRQQYADLLRLAMPNPFEGKS